MLLFAYGTLRDPRRVATVTGLPGCCRAVAPGTVDGVLYDVGEYPALRPPISADDRVPGVLLEIDDAALARLDDYEGVGEGLYLRERCTVQCADGRAIEAWVYIFNQPTATLRRIAQWPNPG